MNITTTRYKDIPAICLENATYRMTLLPGEGGKVVSFQTVWDGREFLWQNPAPAYEHIGPADSYVAGECSSFDDMFPTIDPITPATGSRAGVEYPDHGEVCRLPFSCRITEEGVEMELTSPRLGYTYRKSVRENGDGEFVVRYEITNRAEDAFSALWAGHCMLAVREGGQVIAPFGADAQVEIMFDDHGVFGRRGERRAVEPAMRISRTEAETVNSFKYYYTDQATEGRLGYRTPDGVTFWLCYDSTALPYVGVWVNNGNFNNSYCVGLEPCNLGYDTVENAAERGQHFAIAPGDTWAFDLTFTVFRKESYEHH